MQEIDFIHNLKFTQLPQHVINAGRRCMIDLIAVAAAGSLSKSSNIMADVISQQMPGDHKILFRDETCSAIGAGWVNANIIDSYDAHDGHVLCKGHVGVTVFPAVCAFYGLPQDLKDKHQQQEWLTTLILGYELGTRNGIALHRTSCDYHTSGAWNALAAAAIGARALKLNKQQTRHALGIAEYHGPRSQMMRVIDNPSMLKDGSGMGAMAGISSALLAHKGFTGAPAITIESPELKSIYADIGNKWFINEQYFKHYPICRWAQPAVEAAIFLREKYSIKAEQIKAIKNIEINTFHEAVRLGSKRPESSEDIQYGLGYAFSCALIYGEISPEKILFDFKDDDIYALLNKIHLSEKKEFNQCFPESRWAEVTITLNNGEIYQSGKHRTIGDADNPYDDAVLINKARQLFSLVMDNVQSDEMMDYLHKFAV